MKNKKLPKTKELTFLSGGCIQKDIPVDIILTVQGVISGKVFVSSHYHILEKHFKSLKLEDMGLEEFKMAFTNKTDYIATTQTIGKVSFILIENLHDMNIVIHELTHVALRWLFYIGHEITSGDEILPYTIEHLFVLYNQEIKKIKK